MTLFCLLITFLSLPVCFAEDTNPSRISAKPYIQSYTQARVDLRRDTVIYRQEKVIFGVDFKGWIYYRYTAHIT